MTDDAGRSVTTARLRRLFTEWPDEEALQFTENDASRWFTWRDVAVVHQRLAAELDAHAVPSGAAIAVVMRQRPVLVAAELAVLAEGRAALLVTSLQADRGLADEIMATAPAVIVGHSADWERGGVGDAIASSGALGIEVDDDFEVRVRNEVETVQPGPDLDAAVTVLSSGTTGPAKRLPVPWETFVRLGGGPEGREPKSGKGALILSLPLVTLGGLLSMARLVFGGRPMSMTERFDVHTWASLVKQHRPKIMGAPPPLVKMILDADISPDSFEGVTAYMTSSAAIAPEVIGRFEQRYGIPVLLGYGATEFLNSVTGWTARLWSEFGAAKVGSVGRPLAGVKLRVLDPETVDHDDPVEVPVGEEGVLEVDPPQRAGELPDGWLRTSDRARIDADGFLWILGRTDDVIVRGGFKVDLQLVESTLGEHPAVIDVCAVGLADERLGQVPAAVVTCGSSEPSGDELIAWLRERVPPYAVPVSIRLVDAIPQTTTFKPHRAEVVRLLIAD